MFGFVSEKAPVMNGKINGCCRKIKENEGMSFISSLHQEALSTDRQKISHITDHVIKTVNFIERPFTRPFTT